MRRGHLFPPYNEGGVENVPVLKYKDPGDGLWKPVPVGAGGSGSIVAAYRNVLINGGMTVAQRGNGPFVGDAVGVDGWYAYGVTGTRTWSRIPQALGAGSPLLNGAITGQSGATAVALNTSSVEDVSTLAGSQVVVSLTASVNTAPAKIGVELYQYFGTGGSPSADVYVPTQTITLTTTLTRYSLVFNIPSVAGKTRGTNGNDLLGINLWVSAGANSAVRAGSIGIQNKTFKITDVQIEAGATATAFERLPQATRLEICQRYFQRWEQPPLRGTVNGTGQISRAGMTLPVTMRANPVPTMIGNFVFTDGVNYADATTLAQNYTVNPGSVEYDFTCAPMFPWPGSAVAAMQGEGGILDLSAEI